MMDEETKRDLVASCRARADFYRFMASLFLYELTEDQIQALAHADLPCDGSDIGRGYAVISEFLRHRDGGTRQQLAVDYAHVFLGAGNHDKLTAPPYESVYTSKERLLMQDARDGAVKFYRAEGLGLPEGNRTPEDHVGFELQFMAAMADRAADAVGAGDADCFRHCAEVQQRFFREHMDNWLPRFADDIEENCKTDFYRGVALLVRGLLAVEGPMVRDVAAVAEGKGASREGDEAAVCAVPA